MVKNYIVYKTSFSLVLGNMHHPLEMWHLLGIMVPLLLAGWVVTEIGPDIKTESQLLLSRVTITVQPFLQENGSIELLLLCLSGKFQNTEASHTDLASLSEERPHVPRLFSPSTFAILRFGDMRHKSTHFVYLLMQNFLSKFAPFLYVYFLMFTKSWKMQRTANKL